MSKRAAEFASFLFTSPDSVAGVAVTAPLTTASITIDEPENIVGYTKILTDEVMPMVERSYNISRNREQHAIAGLSMGGAETMYTALNHLDKFAWIGSFSGAFVMSRGLVGSKGETPKVASPVYKQTFDLRTGECLDDPSVALRTFAVRVVDGRVEVGR